MGFYSSESTSSTTTAPLSAEGRQWDSLFQSIVLSQLESSGYDLNPQEVTEYEDPSRANQLQNEVANIQKEIDLLNTDLQSKPWQGPSYQAPDPRQTKLQQLQQRLTSQQRELDKQKKVTYTDFGLKKKEDPRVQQAIDKFGADAPEVAQMRKSLKDAEVFKLTSMSEIETEYFGLIKKLVKGDLSYTAEQKQSIDQFIDPVRDTLLKTLDDVQKEVDRGDRSMRDSLNLLSEEIDRTGFSVMDALKAAEIQIDKSGENLFAVLRKANQSAQERAKFEFDMLSDQADQRAAQQAALLGLPPGSMTEKLQSQKMKEQALSYVTLKLAEDETSRSLGIASGVEQGKQNISLSRVMLAENQGAKKEAVAQMGLGITQQTAGAKLGIAGQKASALTALEQQRSAELKDLVTGGIITRAQAAQGTLGFDQAQRSGEIGIANQLLSPIQQRSNIEQQRSFAESTTRQTSTPSFFDVATSAAATGVAAYTGLGGGGRPSVASSFMNGGSYQQPSLLSQDFADYRLKPAY